MPKGIKGFQKGSAAYTGARARRTKSQIKTDIETGLKNAMDITLEETAKKAVKDFQSEARDKYLQIMNLFYGDYHPEMYKRNKTFINADYINDIYDETTSSVIGGIEFMVDNIPPNTYSNILPSRDGAHKIGDPFDPKYVFKMAFESGVHGYRNIDHPSKESKLLRVEKIMNPSPSTQMDRWCRSYQNDTDRIKKLMNEYYAPMLFKTSKREINKTAAARRQRIQNKRNKGV